MYHFFIGIDISKLNFSVAIHNEKKIYNFANSQAGFSEFCNIFQSKLLNSLVILETTGGYEAALIKYLAKNSCAIHRANTRQVKSFIRSYGIVGKSDSIDAKGLALYGFERHSKLKLFKENPHKNLLKLVQRRDDLKQILVQEKNRLQAPDQEYLKDSFKKIIAVLETEIDEITLEIEKIINENKKFAEIKTILKTVSGIGDIVASYLIALIPEIGTIDRKKIASLAGLAPHPYESGKKIGYRKTKGGRQDVKRILFLSAMTAARSNTALGDFYKRLVAQGKKKMVVLTALMRKILVIANAKVRDHLALAAV